MNLMAPVCKESKAPMNTTLTDSSLRLAIIGAGPVGIALALIAARNLPHAQISLFDTRPLDQDISADARTLALSLGSIQLLQRLNAWDMEAAQPILEVHVSQQPPSLPAVDWLPARLKAPELRIRAIDEAVPLLGAVMSYGAVTERLQRAWLDAQAAEPLRLHSRFGQTVGHLKNLGAQVEVDASIAEHFDLAVVAEGGVFSNASSDAARPDPSEVLAFDYRQTAWVGKVRLEGAAYAHTTAYERFTRHGPAALLPLKNGGAGLVWCVNADDDPVLELDEAQRITVLNSVFPAAVGRIAEITSLKSFALGLKAQHTLTDGRIVRIGNAAQTLHPVAGQGLNLGLRDAFELVQALSRNSDVQATLWKLEWQRAPDRWSLIAATDFLARSFTWKLPGAGAARGLGLAALQTLGPVKSALARQMMFGLR